MRWPAVLLLAGCTFGKAPQPPEALHGAPLPAALPRPDLSLTTSRGARYDFRRETAGTTTLVFFGYTRCPDICPVTMATLAAVLGDLPPGVAAGVRLLFITTDPERDTPAVLDGWLRRVAPTAVGLTGTREEVARAERLFNLPPSSIDSSAGRYDVGHAAQVIVFTPDDSARFAYPFGTRQADWAADLPRLAAWRRRP